ncbi:MAG TPA: family 2A encapsulin nanocompartment cargo protein cysteine desulfurase [Anaerolineales bacterium]|nr:family 2A encapsulin nanocompartment cargo protein cysteine desulfurase [Anaerolineales bacterium]
MNIPTPTNPEAAGLPSEAALARLANEFFKLLPGTLAPTPSHATRQEPVIGAAAPALTASPAAAPAATSLPEVAREGRAGGRHLELPATYAPALPTVDVPAITPRLSPFYFLGEFAAYVPAKSTADRVTAQSAQLPGASDLNAALAQITLGFEPRPAPAPDAAYYFIDPAVQPPGVAAAAHPPFDVHAVRRDFPILSERVNGRPLVWLDNAATTQKPQAVIDRLSHFYRHENSNVHRAAHELAARSTDAYEGARKKVAAFLGAGSPNEIVFVRGATEGINLVAQTFGRTKLGPGDEIVVSQLEHHANIVPWQQVAAERGAKLRVIPVDDDGQILLDAYQRLLTDRTRIVAITQVSNALGTITPVQEIVALAHRAGAVVLVDGAQAVSHLRVNVQALDADFYVFSGHKVFGPTGIGVVYGKQALLDDLPPWQGGGNMIADVTFERTLYQQAPARFEAGTGNIADAVGLGAALDYLQQIGLENVSQYEHHLLHYALDKMRAVPGLRLIGTAPDKASVLSFTLAGYEPLAVGRALNEEGIAVRAGHHCAQPILRRMGVEATVRPSLALYNTCDEVDQLVAALHRLARR